MQGCDWQSGVGGHATWDQSWGDFCESSPTNASKVLLQNSICVALQRVCSRKDILGIIFKVLSGSMRLLLIPLLVNQVMPGFC